MKTTLIQRWRDLRPWVDLALCVAFAALLALAVRHGERLSLSLSLAEGGQRLGLYQAGTRVGALEVRVRRAGSGYAINKVYRVRGQIVLATTQRLRKDLSLELSKLEGSIGPTYREISPLPLVVQRLVARGKARLTETLKLKARCDVESGDCRVGGTLGRRPLHFGASAGRGPSLSDAIYPLLIQGALGREVELRIFDPLQVSQRLVTYRLQRREELRLRRGAPVWTRAVRRDLGGRFTRAWVDDLGRVVKEELMSGLVLEHEEWLP